MGLGALKVHSVICCGELNLKELFNILGNALICFLTESFLSVCVQPAAVFLIYSAVVSIFSSNSRQQNNIFPKCLIILLTLEKSGVCYKVLGI